MLPFLRFQIVLILLVHIRGAGDGRLYLYFLITVSLSPLQVGPTYCILFIIIIISAFDIGNFYVIFKKIDSYSNGSYTSLQHPILMITSDCPASTSSKKLF